MDLRPMSSFVSHLRIPLWFSVTLTFICPGLQERDVWHHCWWPRGFRGLLQQVGGGGEGDCPKREAVGLWGQARMETSLWFLRVTCARQDFEYLGNQFINSNFLHFRRTISSSKWHPCHAEEHKNDQDNQLYHSLWAAYTACCLPICLSLWLI